MYKLRLKNESGVFESIARVDIEGPPGRPKKVEEKVEQVKVIPTGEMFFPYQCLRGASPGGGRVYWCLP